MAEGLEFYALTLIFFSMQVAAYLLGIWSRRRAVRKKNVPSAEVDGMEYVLTSVFGLLALLVGGLLPLGRLLFQPLETRFTAPDPTPERVAGIVVLGGALAVDVLARWGEPALNDSAERVVAAVDLARRWPEARVLHSGGGTAHFGTRPSEADAARLWFAQVGLAPDRLLLEDRSLNTAENARFSKALVDPKPGEVWLLVTSAWHMPRAVGAFRQAGWSVVPWPVDHRSTGRLAWDPARTAAENLRDLDNAVREWLGLAYYRWRGWTDRLVPLPA